MKLQFNGGEGGGRVQNNVEKSEKVFLHYNINYMTQPHCRNEKNSFSHSSTFSSSQHQSPIIVLSEPNTQSRSK